MKSEIHMTQDQIQELLVLIKKANRTARMAHEKYGLPNAYFVAVETPDAPWLRQDLRAMDDAFGLVPLKPTVKSERQNQERELKEAQEAYRKDARDERLVDNLRRVFG